jgi:hypothetical protein
MKVIPKTTPLGYQKRISGENPLKKRRWEVLKRMIIKPATIVKIKAIKLIKSKLYWKGIMIISVAANINE